MAHPLQVALRAVQGLAAGRLPPHSPLFRRPPGKRPIFARFPALVGHLPKVIHALSVFLMEPRIPI